MDVEEASAIGERARMIRRRRGMSLEVAAGLAKITKGCLSMLERGQRGFNRRGLIEDLADALGCSVADLTGQRHLASKDAQETLTSPAIIGFARWYWALELTSTAARTRAHAVLSEGIDDLTPAVQVSAVDTLAAEIVGMMHLQQARTAARQQRADDAHAHLDEAAHIAGRVGECNGMRQHFGPTNVAAWRASIGVELAEGAKVYEDVMAAPVDVAALGSRERSASLHFDLARSLAQEDGPRDADVIRQLDTADRIAPQRIRNDPIARDLALTLDRRALRRVWELDSLLHRFGVGGRGQRSVNN